ncbi:hypothetical protein PUNSTDRAFT_109798 [Punctularia strigosozonata HHB-11173 SS5]|uniref:uncharacterized protein n=1 Tax=Punctularia strigosozonata (strain HHB-11173) TaxID=741275 RepID=UPI0004416E44|nr:uncharacterized protein PUNSTDRAFT_109798 [Punctularia strigosozonata HHB-11173 SS5]EIN13606.1 hypothetical protein PUNSTDRAFT_109798 [Punctularia strigosozonata HHB-11173 SS5]
MGRKSKVRVQEEETEDELYQVEVIEKARVDEHSQWWAGYPADQNTWEPDENLASCRRLLESFWAQFPDPDVDYDIGQELIPPQEWIDKEKARSFAEQQTLNAERDKKKAARANGKLEKKKAKAQAAKSRSGSVSSDVHLPGPLTNSKRSNKKAEQNVSSTRRDTSMDTDDDQPLANSIKKAKKQRKVMILDDDEDMDSTSDGKPLLSLRNPLKEGKIRAPDSHSEVIKRPGSPSNNSVISLSSSSSDEPLSRTLPKKTKGLSDQVPVSQVKAHHKLPKIRNLPLALPKIVLPPLRQLPPQPPLLRPRFPRRTVLPT